MQTARQFFAGKFVDSVLSYRNGKYGIRGSVRGNCQRPGDFRNGFSGGELRKPEFPRAHNRNRGAVSAAKRERERLSAFRETFRLIEKQQLHVLFRGISHRLESGNNTEGVEPESAVRGFRESLYTEKRAANALRHLFCDSVTTPARGNRNDARGNEPAGVGYRIDAEKKFRRLLRFYPE